jgi:hypothetical protein
VSLATIELLIRTSSQHNYDPSKLDELLSSRATSSNDLALRPAGPDRSQDLAPPTPTPT